MNTIFRRVLSSTITPSRLGQNYLRYVGTTNRFADKENSQASTDSESKKTFTKDMLDQMVRTNKVVIFMKGNPEQPRCGFSNAVVQILRMHGVQYDAHDVLQNEELRQSIKEFTEWPTIPQIFINGDFVGGCDILLQMHQSGDLIEELKKIGIESALLNEAEDKSTEKPK